MPGGSQQINAAVSSKPLLYCLRFTGAMRWKPRLKFPVSRLIFLRLLVELVPVFLYVSEYLSGGADNRVCRSAFTLTPQPFSVGALLASKPLGSKGAIFHAHWFSVAAKRTLTGCSLKREVQAFSPKCQSHVYSAGWMKDRDKKKKKMRGVEKNSEPDEQDENNFFACLRVWFMIML